MEKCAGNELPKTYTFALNHISVNHGWQTPSLNTVTGNCALMESLRCKTANQAAARAHGGGAKLCFCFHLDDKAA